jgi:PhnB protein
MFPQHCSGYNPSTLLRVKENNMKTLLAPYIGFKDNARAAMEFYHSVFGGKLDMTTFAEGRMPHEPVEADKIMHAMIEADNGLTFMAADTPSGVPYVEGANISISLSGDNEEELRGYWGKLADGGTVTMPFEKAPWGDIFGMLTDKFGINWMVDIGPEKAE